MLKVLSVVFLAALATPAAAQFVGPGPVVTVTTVAEVANVRIDSDVTVVGHIVGSLGGGDYTFRDDTGEIRVEIDRDIWRGRQVSGDTKVQLTGEVDRDRRGRYIDVDEMVLLD